MEIILLSSIIFLLVAVLLAIKLIKITKVFYPWILVAVAIFLVVIRRSITLIHLLKENTTVSGETSSEYVVLAVSILLSVGLFFMIPLFNSIKKHERELEKKNELLFKSNETIIRNEEKFKNLWNLSFEGILIHDNSIALETNLSLLNMFGYNGTELIGKNIIKLLILKKHHETVFKNIAQNHTLPYVIEGIRKDGTVFPIEVEARDFISEGNKALRVVAFRDVTEREAIESENKNLANLIEQSANTIMITDTEGRVEYTNQSFTDVSGYTAAEVLGNFPSMLKSNFHPKEFYTHLWKTIKSGKTWRGEFQNKNKKGKLFWEKATITPIKNEEGKIINFLSIREDVTALKKAREKLILSNQKFKNIVENTSEWIYELDERGFITYSNSVVEKIFGYKAKDIIG
ncbi:MAG: PAS domain S-box protein, partial [Bacteroidetes bacterium]|nr:PAS domain S-box protein [Bacteroidota bacterium]